MKKTRRVKSGFYGLKSELVIPSFEKALSLIDPEIIRNEVACCNSAF